MKDKAIEIIIGNNRMLDKPKFSIKDPQNREERLITELINDLDSVTFGFIKLNFKGNIDQEQFVVLRDGAIGYAGAMIRDLVKLLANKDQIKPFLEEAKQIFNCYLDITEK